VDVRNQEQVDRLLREANVFRMRRQFEQAEERCRAALEIAPADSGVLEMLGDLLREQDQVEKAAEQYRLALEQDPNRATLEKKYAELALAMAERQRQRDLAQLALDNPAAFRTPKKKKNVAIALFLSLVWPGLGQFYIAEGLDVKGVILAVAALLSFRGLAALFEMLLVFSGMSRGSGASGSAVLGLLFCLLQVYAIGDAVFAAQKSSSSPTDRLGF
jgi:tetratricopeptide (TPR) repeat protein